MDALLAIAIALLGGVVVTLQGQFMGVLQEALGTKGAVFVTYAGGGLVIVLLTLLSGGTDLGAFRQVPWYAFTTGILGLIIVGSVGFVVPRLGLAAAFTLIVASQFAAAVVIDHFGLLGAAVQPVDLPRAVGLGVMLVGVWLIMR